MNRARKFYEDILEQKVKVDFGANVAFESGFAIHLRSHFSGLIDNREILSGSNNFEIYFEHNEVDEFAKKLKENNVKFVHDVREQPWRQKVVRFYDPDENIIEVGESLEYLSFRLHNEGMSIADISKSVGIPEEFVKAAVDGLKK
jgi:predicted enzyme related to lactoylglutathione lyase